MTYLTIPTEEQLELLPLWAAAIRRADPHATMVVATSSAAPLPRRCLRLHAPFDTSAPLVGVAGLVGLWRVGAGLLAKADELVYLEPGMCLTSTRSLDYFLGNPAVLFEGGESLQPCSGLFALRKEAVQGIDKVLARPWSYADPDKTPAAVLLARFLLVNCPQAYLVPFMGGADIRAVQPAHLGGHDAASLCAAETALQCDHPALHAAYLPADGARPADITRRAFHAALRALSTDEK